MAAADTPVAIARVAVPSAAWRGRWRDGLSYGALGLPLAFVALPLYVQLPHHYAATYGVPLAALGALLLGARLLDALADPWIGRACDRWLALPARQAVLIAALAACVLAAGFRGLFVPPVHEASALLPWAGALLVVTYLAYSVLSVLHQAWGARLGGDETQRTRIVSWREALALAGVLLASVLPALAGHRVTTLLFAGLLVLAVGLLGSAPSAAAASAAVADPPVALAAPLRDPDFRRLLAVHLLNGVATAVPATLVIFFVRDRLQAPAWEPLFLGAYFAAGALSMPLWVALVGRWGLRRSWLTGMVLAIAGFAGAAALRSGDVAAYLAICVASGVALGADLALPPALLAGVVQGGGHAGRREGAYFGWWNLATKLNLALAAGLALPLLQLLGYRPGSTDDDALQALALTYGALPCALKAAAALLLWRRPPHTVAATP